MMAVWIRVVVINTIKNIWVLDIFWKWSQLKGWMRHEREKFHMTLGFVAWTMEGCCLLDEMGNAEGRAGLGRGETSSSANRLPSTEVE